mmetsp:Transcript_14019/g.30519  ORF Transcript_14019/g.30519 Transcript_14019/m.30519 type:complete len:236 (-) Transcript_14019:86-793(-)
MTLPVEDEDDENHYLAPSEARMKIESENLSLEKLKSYLPNTKNNTEEKKYIAERKKEDKSFVFDFTKVRATARCNYCGATRVIYSHKKVGVKDGPTVKDLEKLKSSLERNGYNCGDKITVGKFYAHRALMCGHPIEPYYHNPNTGTKGGRIVTKDICAVCYVNDDLVTPNEMIKSLDLLGGKAPLTICRGCFESGVEPPSPGGRPNVRQATQQAKATKKHDGAVVAGKRKARTTK